jgi:hypothetical protein
VIIEKFSGRFFDEIYGIRILTADHANENKIGQTFLFFIRAHPRNQRFISFLFSKDERR